MIVGNSSTCLQVIIVDDSTPAVITLCPANITIECTESTAPANTGNATASDNCDTAPSVTFNDVTTASQICPQEYTINGLQGRVGLVYDYFKVNNDPFGQSRNDLTGILTATIPIFKALQLNTQAKLGLAENFGNFDLRGDLTIKAGRSMTLTSSLGLFRSEPSYNSRTLAINGAEVFDTSFNKPFGSVLEASLFIPGINLTASLAQTVVNNPVYWDTLGLPRQASEVFYGYPSQDQKQAQSMEDPF